MSPDPGDVDQDVDLAAKAPEAGFKDGRWGGEVGEVGLLEGEVELRGEGARDRGGVDAEDVGAEGEEGGCICETDAGGGACHEDDLC